jgi:hypothetical protein
MPEPEGAADHPRGCEVALAGDVRVRHGEELDVVREVPGAREHHAGIAAGGHPHRDIACAGRRLDRGLDDRADELDRVGRGDRGQRSRRPDPPLLERLEVDLVGGQEPARVAVARLRERVVVPGPVRVDDRDQRRVGNELARVDEQERRRRDAPRAGLEEERQGAEGVGVAARPRRDEDGGEAAAVPVEPRLEAALEVGRVHPRGHPAPTGHDCRRGDVDRVAEQPADRLAVRVLELEHRQ